jgi:hypothetical protein
MEWAVVVAFLLAFGAASAQLAARKGRSRGWWFLGGALGGIPVLLLAAFATPPDEPWRFRSPVILLALAVALITPFALLAVVGQYT